MSGKPSTPVTSPKIPKTVKVNPPSTPPSSSKNKHKRLSTSLLKTPEQDEEHLPFSPSLKRTSSGTYKSPDYKLNSHNIQSPYTTSSLLKTPRHLGYESDENEGYKLKLQKTPQYFSPGKKLFNEESKEAGDLGEISTQLKNNLSSALGKLQRKNEQRGKFKFTELTFDSDVSPKKKLKNDSSDLSPSKRTNLNLQTLQQSPIPKGSSSSPTVNHHPTFGDSESQSPARFLNENESLINVPSPNDNDDSSAHNALMAALSRQRRKSRSSMSSPTRPRLINATNHEFNNNNNSRNANEKMKLPPLNMALGSNTDLIAHDDNANNEGKDENNEKDAVLSLMSLSSPQSVSFSHSRTHSRTHSRNQSLNLGSPSKSATALGPSPTGSQLPPISGLINKNYGNEADNDATDIDDDVTDEDLDNN
ncbi:uncharacterized protein PRCAT00002221001 [Priceomyces carsonii]|uniref:uncharacterized protein n=1 Tax=Priceomyces carsonii TaxID=28549 RepID=UPI002ED9B1C7|nr:unnamed protein product [Priceomyces carsonii]